MNCENARQYWSLYHDSEGDAALHFEISQHLSRCDACSEWFARQSYLETLLEEEILLALPIAPVHEREHCEGSRIVEKYRPERESPFAVLKNFNRKK